LKCTEIPRVKYLNYLSRDILILSKLSYEDKTKWMVYLKIELIIKRRIILKTIFISCKIRILISHTGTGIENLVECLLNSRRKE